MFEMKPMEPITFGMPTGFREAVDTLGNEGWEMVSLGSTDGSTSSYWFKRPRQ